MVRDTVFFVPAARWTAAAVLTATLLAFSGAAAFAATPSTSDDASQIPGGPSLQFVGTETGSWESNPLMLFHGAQPLWGSVTSPELIFNGRTPTSQLSVDETVNENIFNQTDFNSTDLHSKANFTEQMQRWGFQLQQNTDYDTTRTSELFPVGFNNVISNVPVRHLGLTEAPTITYSPTAIDKLSLAGSLTNSQYDNPVFINYMQSSVTPSYQHSFDPLNAGTLSFEAQRYQSTSGPPVTVNSVGPQIGWIGNLTPRFTAQVAVGVQSSDQYGPGVPQAEPWSLQYTYAADLAFKGIQDTTHFIATRADYPFGNGTESLLTTYSITENHAINPLFSVNAAASYQSADYLASSPGNLQDLITGSGGLTWHATERLDISANYQFRYETLVSTSGAARDNMGTLSLIYRPQAWGL